MITVFGFQIGLPESLQFLGNILGSFLGTLVAWLLIALIAYLVLTYALRWLTHWLPGEVDDIILGIIRKPLLFLIVIFGMLNSLEVLQFSASIINLVERIADSALILIVAYLMWRLLIDIVIYYGQPWAERTESRVDDVIMPVVKLFGPVIIGLITLAIILSLWGINITSVLVGAGVVGLVLGLALQDTLSNIFSGINLLMDAPFRIGDLVVLPDSKICQVERIGMRATQLYHLDDHSTIYMPNKELANAALVNITRPTVDLKVTVEVGVAYDSDLDKVKALLEGIANAHPNVLGNIPDKMKLLAEEIATSKNSEEMDKYHKMLEKLSKEHFLNQQILSLIKELQDMAQAIKHLETGGLTISERRQIQIGHVADIELCVERVTKAMSDWNIISDPWTHPIEQKADNERWNLRNQRLLARWGELKNVIQRPGEREMRLDDLAEELIRWIGSEFKLPPEPWKEPQVSFKSFGSSSVDFQLDFYVDDIRLEHFERKQRVITEIACKIHRRFQEEGIEIPFPQMDVRFTSQQPNREPDK